ncbi:MAG TPA: FadR family transcriptional regulator [Desulfobulbus sp.]|nr:FadR family transcriptional regulator [Desulfobulbus sp.]
MRFKKAKQNRIFQDIVDQIQQAITGGELKPGERLPSERELCTIFTTSRGTLREAFRILEQKKLITIKLGAGGGAVVREPNSELITENLLLLLEAGQGTRRHLIALSGDLAAQVATLAATLAGGKDVGPLKQLVATLTKLLGSGNKDENPLISMDALLFKELADIGGNPLYGFLLQAALTAIGRSHDNGGAAEEMRRNRHFQEIRMIVYAVARNNRKEAKLLAHKHILGLAAPDD